jgi:hypothetical protein
MNKDNLIEFAKEQCEIFPEDSYMGEYLRETIKMLQAEPCEDAISRQAVLNTLDNMDKVLDEDRTVENYKDLLKECYEVLPSVKPVACIATVKFSKEDMQELVEEKMKDIVVEHKKGKWMKSNIGGAKVCSLCQVHMGLSNFKFCPSCGAEMEGEE